MIARGIFHLVLIFSWAWIPVSTLMSNEFDSTLEALWLQNIRQITFPEMGFEKAGEAYFSPDGETILFQAVPTGQLHYQIYAMRLDDPTPRLVSTGLGACTCAFFRPDSQKIIFASSHSDPLLGLRPEKITAPGTYVWDLTPYMNIYEANPDGSDLKPLTTGPAYHAECAYSHDGLSIVYASNESGSMNLYVMDADGSNPRQITHTTHCYNGGPFFSPDSSKILYRADREVPHYLQIFAIDSDGSNDIQLTDNTAVNWAPYWHPSGRMIAYTTSLHGHRHYEIYMLDLESQQHYRITHNENFDGLPVFSPTGNRLMWTSKRGPDQTCQLFIADFSLPPQLKEFP
jgi:Tol biopolymer transport system component